MSRTDAFGVSPALISPLDAKGNVDVEALAAHADDLLGRGCSSVTLFGTTGEGPSFGLGERDRVASALVAEGIAPDRLIEGVIASSLDEAVVAMRRAYARGARAVLLAPPFYYHGAGEAGILAWFQSVFRALGRELRDVILYHIPAVTGIPVGPAIVALLAADFPGAISAIKDSSGDRATTDLLLAAHGNLRILVGDERYLGSACAAGASGAISGIANILPERIAATVAEGRDDPEIVALTEAVLAHPVVPAIRALTAHGRGKPAFAAPRPPLSALDPDAAAALGAQLDRLRVAAPAANGAPSPD
jgi:4-hydroxy-tetrahydrodipicolinate synthase